jgi:hypothetical protein
MDHTVLGLGAQHIKELQPTIIVAHAARNSMDFIRPFYRRELMSADANQAITRFENWLGRSVSEIAILRQPSADRTLLYCINACRV